MRFSRAMAAFRADFMRASTAASARATMPRNVAENRARMAAALGVAAATLSHRLSNPFAERRRRRSAVDGRNAAARRRHRHAHARARHRRDHRRLRPDPLRRSAGARHRRRACRLARRTHRRHRGDGRGDGTARRRTRPYPRRDRSDDPAGQLRSRPRSDRALCRRGPGQQPFLRAARREKAMPCSILAAMSRRGSSAPASDRSRISACAPTPIRHGFSATAAPRIAPRLTTAGTSTPSRWSTDAPPHCSRRLRNSLGLQREILRG